MEAPLHQYPVPVPPPIPAQDASSLLQQAVAARALIMATGAGAGNKQQAPSSGPGREECPRCASRDTKFCYYNNYNTAQPRHFCRACRRYWTLGGSLRNVPVGGSTRKRPRPRPARGSTRAAMAAAVAMATRAASTVTTTTTASSSGGGSNPFAAFSPAAGGGGGGLLFSSLLLAGSASASSASPLLALGLGSAPLLEGRLGCFDIGLGEDATALGAAAVEGAAAAGMAHHQQQQLPLPWPAATTAPILECDRAETTTTTTWNDASSSVFPFPPAAALWQELAVAAPALHHGIAPHLLL